MRTTGFKVYIPSKARCARLWIRTSVKICYPEWEEGGQSMFLSLCRKPTPRLRPRPHPPTPSSHIARASGDATRHDGLTGLDVAAAELTFEKMFPKIHRSTFLGMSGKVVCSGVLRCDFTQPGIVTLPKAENCTYFHLAIPNQRLTGD